ncbi:hypothetical protein CF134_20200 [Aeromonas salmonicida]|nr:hypothetical protein K931_00075 [Aeromonas salmonicida subsp. pectinolytica 34mel]TNI10617.1 hypothetical protein CF134_20200 [Aeromonas salmonicida]
MKKRRLRAPFLLMAFYALSESREADSHLHMSGGWRQCAAQGPDPADIRLSQPLPLICIKPVAGGLFYGQE